MDVEAFVTAGYGYNIRCEIVGEAGTLELLSPSSVAVRREFTESLVVPAELPAALRHRLPARAAELDRAIAHHEPFDGASAWDGYAAAAVCEAAVASLGRGGEPVDVAMGAITSGL